LSQERGELETKEIGSGGGEGRGKKHLGGEKQQGEYFQGGGRSEV